MKVKQAAAPRARRHRVTWPVRIRRIDGDDHWHGGVTVNLSVTGVLIRSPDRFLVGDYVEVQIEFLPRHARSVVSGLGKVVREDVSVPGGSAIHFLRH